ncbi:MAG: HD-GYP domain-containing protein [Actinomycetota bacterium]
MRSALGRFSSLGVLFSLSLTFPDAAPSRMRAFIGSNRSLPADRLESLVAADFDASSKAKRLADLVARVSRREARSGRHSDRVRGYVELIAAELDLPAADVEKLRWATLLHDVGLLDVPARILDSRGELTAQDRAFIEEHPVHAVGHLAPFADWLGPWAGAATDHHERWDGTGYPAGLSGEEISLAGRIVAVADAYDAMTALRSYQKPISSAAARRELVDNAGSQFDPAIVRAFLESGIRRSRLGLGAIGALADAPGQLVAAVSGAGAGAGATASVAAVSAVAIATTAVVPEIVDDPSPPPAVERIVEAEPTTTTSTTSTTSTTTTTAAPTTSEAPALVASTTTTTTAPPTTAPPTTTSPPTTAAPTTTTSAAAPTTTTTTSTVPAYPSTPPPTVPPPTYPSV